MEKLYFWSFIVLGIILILFESSFFFLDSEKHDASYFDIYENGINIGSIRIDTYSTDEKRIYISAPVAPYDKSDTTVAVKLTLSHDFSIDEYYVETEEDGAPRSIAIESSKSGLAYLGRFNAHFLYLASLPDKK